MAPRCDRFAQESLPKYGAGGRFYGDRTHGPSFLLLEKPCDSGQRATGAYSSNDDINRAVGVIPYFRTGRGLVNRWIGRILKLLQLDISPGLRRDELLRFRDGSSHPMATRGHEDSRSVGDEQRAHFHAGVFWHGQRKRIASRGGDECESDASVTTRRFNELAPWSEKSTLLSIPHERGAEAAFYRVRGVPSFDLREKERPI
jgi:hypothetical protein